MYRQPNFVQPQMRQNSNMGTRQRAPVNMQQSQNAQFATQYPQQAQPVTMYVQQPGLPAGYQQVIRVPGSGAAQVAQYAPQYTINTNNPQFQLSSNMQYAYQPNPMGIAPTQVYYNPGQPTGAPPAMPPQQTQPITSMNQTPGYVAPSHQTSTPNTSYQKRQRQGITIVNPDTMEVVQLDSKTDARSGQNSGGSSARGTPVLNESTPPPPAGQAHPAGPPQQQSAPGAPQMPKPAAPPPQAPQTLPPIVQPKQIAQAPVPPTPAAQPSGADTAAEASSDVNANAVRANFATQVAARMKGATPPAPVQEKIPEQTQSDESTIPADQKAPQNVPQTKQPVSTVPATQVTSQQPQVSTPQSNVTVTTASSLPGTAAPGAPQAPPASAQLPASSGSSAPVISQEQPVTDKKSVKEQSPPPQPKTEEDKSKLELQNETKASEQKVEKKIDTVKQDDVKQDIKKQESESKSTDDLKPPSSEKTVKESETTAKVQPAKAPVDATPTVIKSSETDNKVKEESQETKSPEVQPIDLRTTMTTPGGTKHPLDLRTVMRTPGGSAHLRKQLANLPAELMAGADTPVDTNIEPEPELKSELKSELNSSQEEKPVESKQDTKVEEKVQPVQAAEEKAATEQKTAPAVPETESTEDEDKKKKPRQRLKEEEKKEEPVAPEKEKPVINQRFDFNPGYFKEPTPVPPRPTPPVANNVDTTRKTSTPPPSRVAGGGATTATTDAAAQQSNDEVARRNEVNDAKSSTTTHDQTAPTAASDEPSVISSATPKPQALQYNYKEDQWSPLNMEGKKAYDRHFLLQLQNAPESRTKPDGLPNLPEIVLDSVNVSTRDAQSNPRSSFGMSLDFTPGFVRSQTPKGMPPKRSSQSRGGSRGGEPRKVISIQRETIELHRSANAYKTFNKTEKASDELESVVRQFRGLLNKLTPQKFQTLIDQMLKLNIKDEETLRRVIQTIFDKAIDEPGFSVAYANACVTLSKYLVVQNEKGERVSFKSLLLNKCQQEFQKDKSDTTAFEAMQKEIDEAESEEQKKQLKENLQYEQMKAKRRSLGNIRFIGELYKLNMLTEKIMHECVLHLVKVVDEEALECLCRLLATIGKLIDTGKSKNRMDQYFVRIDSIIAKKQTSARVRFMLQDVIELRQNKWVPRRDENNPKTIEQIHKEAQEEKVEKQLNAQRLAQEFRNNPPPRRDRQDRGGQGRNVDGDGWNTVPAKANTLDPGKMKITKPMSSDDNIQLGPGGRGFGGRGRGSTPGRNASQEGERPQKNLNRFQMLAMQGDDSKRGSDSRTSMGPPPSLGQRRSDSREMGGRLGPGGPRGMGGRPSKERERESAMAAVRQLSSGGSRSGRLTPGGGSSRNQSRESSRNRDGAPYAAAQAPAAATTPAPAAAVLAPDKLERKTKAIVDEYLQIHDLKEAVECVKELASEQLSKFVDLSINHVLERNAKARQMTGTLLHDLVKQGVLTLEQYLAGLKELLEFAEDMEIDIPKIWQYFGELISPMVQDGSLPLTFLKSVCDPIKRTGKAGKLVAEVLHDASHRLGQIKVGELWRASSLSWSDFLTEKQDVQQFVKDNKVEFTLAEEAPVSPPPVQSPTPEKVQGELLALLNSGAENEVVFDWVQANIPPPDVKKFYFIRALSGAVCKSTINNTEVNDDLLKKRCILLKRFLDNKADLELQCLFALQALVHDMQHPSGVLRRLFDVLYDEDIISEDAFNQWESNSDPAESVGKGVALSSVNQFFTWLRQTEEEEEQ